VRGLFKVLLIIALAAAAVAEVGSPVWTKTEVTVAARDAAEAGAQNYFTNGDLEKARVAADAAAAVSNAQVESIDVQADGKVHVTVSRQARSYVLYRMSLLKKWYDVRASAAATPH
jgi:Flp pilus assembly protein TadG